MFKMTKVKFATGSQKFFKNLNFFNFEENDQTSRPIFDHIFWPYLKKWWPLGARAQLVIKIASTLVIKKNAQFSYAKPVALVFHTAQKKNRQKKWLPRCGKFGIFEHRIWKFPEIYPQKNEEKMPPNLALLPNFPILTKYNLSQNFPFLPKLFPKFSHFLAMNQRKMS